MRELILSPSLLAADFTRLGEQTLAAVDAGAKYIHIDVMDGAFVPSISFGMPVIKSLRPVTDAVFDVHLMIEDPDRYLTEFKACGADIITVHAEACRHLDRTLQAIHDLGLKAGVALNPATPLCSLDWVLEKADMVLLMSVNPGFGGQRYIDYVTEKIAMLHDMILDAGLDIDIEVDGGVTVDNVRDLIHAGVNVFVAGSSVFRGDPAANTAEFIRIFGEYR